MANTITPGANVVSVAFDHTTDFDLATYLGVPRVDLIKMVFYPNAANDVCIVRQGSATGAILWKYKDTAGSGKSEDFHELPCKPYVKGDEAASGAMISFIYR